jgi:5-methyltetrahydropteroyltriglutamate--homocysteine methyltransferase
VTGTIERPNAITVDWWKYAQTQTDKPVKGMLTGPYTLMDWSFVESYPNRRECTLALARVVHDEVVDLERAGCAFIQVDEPALSTRMDELDLAIEAMGIVTQGVSAKVLTHICYGTFEKVYPQMLDLPLDLIDLEFANSHYRLLDHFERYPFTKEIGFGVVDIHTHRIESVEEIKAGIKKGLEYIPAEKMYVDPDCGLKTRTWEESKAKLANIVAAVNEVRAELGVNTSAAGSR